jgi:hypothetical protein
MLTPRSNVLAGVANALEKARDVDIPCFAIGAERLS